MKGKTKIKTESEAQTQAQRCVIVVQVKDVWMVELRFATHAEAEAHIAKKIIKTGYVIPEMIMPPFSDMISWKPIISLDPVGGMVRVYSGRISSVNLLDRILENLTKQSRIAKMRGSNRGIDTDKDHLAIVWRFLAFENEVCRELIKGNDTRIIDHINYIAESMGKHIDLLKKNIV